MKKEDDGGMRCFDGDAAISRNILKAGGIFAWALAFEQDGGVLLASDELREFLGVPAGAPFPSWDAFVEARVHPESREAVRRAADRARREPGHAISLECRIWSEKADAWRWVLIFGSADETGAAGDCVRLSGGLQDIQTRVEATGAREQEQIAQAQLQQIQANLHTGGRVELEDTLNALTTAAAGR